MPLCERHSSGVEPAVHDLRDPVHALSAFRALDGDLVHIRSVELDRLIDLLLNIIYQLLTRTYAVQVTALALPDRDRCSPVSRSRNSPVLNVLKPVSESLLAYIRRVPVYCVVVCDQLVSELCHLDVPRLVCVVNERCSASPAVRISVLHLLLGVDLVILGKILDDIDIQSVFHYESALPRSLCIAASLVYRLQNSEVILASAVIVVFTESRSCMDDSGTVFCRYVVHACNDERVLALFRHAERLDLLVCPVLHVGALYLLDYLILFTSESLISKRFGYPQKVAFVLAGLHEALNVIYVRSYSKSDVGSECPRCCCPCEEVLVVMVNACTSELAGKSIDLDVLVALSYLVRSKTCSAARAVRQDLISFVNKSLVEGVLDDPPSGLDIVILVSDIRIFHVREISHLLGHIGPHLSVFEYGFTALLVEFLDTVLLDVLLSAESEFLLDLDLNRQSVSIPAAFTLYLESLHCLIPVDGVLESPCHHVVDARLAVSCRRSFIENERRRAFPCLYAKVEHVEFVPSFDLLGLILCYRLVR